MKWVRERCYAFAQSMTHFVTILKISWDLLKWNGLRVGWHSWTQDAFDCNAKGLFQMSSGLFFCWRPEAILSQDALYFISKQTRFSFLPVFFFFHVWLLENQNEYHPNRWLIWACRFQKQLKSWRNNRPPHPAWKAEAVRSNRNECIIVNLKTICRRRQTKIIPFVQWFFPFIHSVLKVYSLEVWWSPVMHAVWVKLGWHLCSSLFFLCMGFSHTRTLSVKVLCLFAMRHAMGA